MSKKSLTVREAAEELDVDADRIYTWIRRGLFVAIDVSTDEAAERRCYRIDRESWEAFKRSRQVAPVTPKRKAPPRVPREILEFC